VSIQQQDDRQLRTPDEEAFERHFSPAAGEPEAGQEPGSAPASPDPASTTDTPPPPDSQPDTDQEVDPDARTDEEVREQVIDLLGERLSNEEAQSLRDFYRWARQNPQHIQAFDAYLSGQAQIVPLGQQPPQSPVGGQSAQAGRDSQPAADPYEDLEPVVAERLREIDQIKERQLAWEREQQQQQFVVAQRAVGEGQTRFQQKMGLSDDEIETLAQEAAGLGMLPHMIQQTGDIVSAVEQTLETAYWRSPEWRSRELQRQVAQQQNDAKRQRKASSLSGSSGSVPRTSPEPSTAAERRDAMVAEIRQAQQDGSLG
jgi:hypothetical protein